MHIVNIGCLCMVIIVLCIVLKFSLKKSLYRVRNVMLVAAIIFLFLALINLTICGLVELFVHGEKISYLYTAEFMKAYANYFILGTIPVLSFMFIAIGISNLALLKNEGIRMKNIFGVLLCLVYLVASTLFYFIIRYFSDFDFGEYGAVYKTIGNIFNDYILPFGGCMLCYFECVLAGVMTMGWLAARQIPKYDKDFIIILGCSISKKGGVLPLLRGRLNKAIKYAWKQEIACGKRVLYVPSGGQGPDEIMSEGSAMALYLESHSAEQDEVFPEKKSRNTYENFKFSREIILKQNPNAKTAFATTNYHVFRSGLLARQVGFEEIEAISSNTKWYFWPNGFAREIVGFFAMTWRVHLVNAIVILGIFLGWGII